jgi:5'-deoxynucleotidase YfbR-like HD superfamily hydrolase
VSLALEVVSRLIVSCREGGATQRCHGAPTLGDASVARHSYNMAVMARLLWPGQHQLVYACLFHDTSERWTGDVPNPAKRQFRAAFEELEARVNKELSIDGELELDTENAQRLRALDLFELQLFAEDQLALGNRNFERMRDHVKELLSDFWVPDVVQRLSASYTWGRTSDYLPFKEKAV